jgi:hypothetical protein
MANNRATRRIGRDLSVTRYRLCGNRSTETTRKLRSDRVSNDVSECIHNFYMCDTTSRLTTGKKQTRFYRRVKEQIRYLTDTIHNLWLRFDSEYPQLAVTRTLFYASRPFYIIQPRLNDREQCGCIKCSNLQVRLLYVT